MMHRLQEFAARIKEKFHSTSIVFLLGLVGMALILLSECAQPTANEDAPPAGTQGLLAEESQTSAQSYQRALETQLSELLSQMEGVGNVAVMITLAASEEVIYATDVQRSDESEFKEHVLLDDGSALSEKVRYPEVTGIAIVCEGGADVAVEVKITNLLCALFNLSSNHISVEKMN